ncbi:hypothetical protein BO78DRAFT_422377 [Aspergillus sclerotiicarbonarius CBS 121057]|uniref:NadR/Ttd14 AAA domain-containing protein n=1 Tax=Aspergillus sclerotiicarbonarius (strain CBS 121057 / IBT 28362) TaxID=1448318 RepID=A0A319E7K7_ASPSB|nr:hypothetical protein BO78DRAFT_422377 [Aspergillus sclerotiicarbonarius CBS 121057]
MQRTNIYIVGAHCTGKTTLIEALRHVSVRLASKIHAENPAIIDEVVRHVMRTDDFNASHVRHPTAGLELQKRTLLAQFKAEEVMDKKQFLSDRSGIDPIVYAGFFLGRPAAEALAALNEWHDLRERMKKALVIVCDPVNESWLSSDGVRMTCESIEEWRSLGQAFRAALEEHEIEYVAIPGGMEGLEERVQFVERLLRSTS